MHSLQHPSIPSSHPKHPCNNQLQLALLLKEEVKKAKLYKCKSFPIYKFPKKYYKIIHSNLPLFENFGCCKHPRLKSRSNHHFISYCKRSKSFLSFFTVFLCLIKIKKRKMHPQNLVRLGTEERENNWRKELTFCFILNLLIYLQTKTWFTSPSPKKSSTFFRLAEVSSCLIGWSRHSKVESSLNDDQYYRHL